MTKTEMVRRMRNGEFGNTLRTWWGWDDFVRERAWIETQHRHWEERPGPFDRKFSLRTKVPNGKFRPGVSPFDLKPEDFATHYLTEAAPDRIRIIQGEYFDGPWHAPGPYFRYSTAATHMVEAMAKYAHDATGELALALIRSAMDEYAWDNFNRLREEWPDHVIEFSVFGSGVGVLGWNTIFWEIRNR